MSLQRLVRSRSRARASWKGTPVATGIYKQPVEGRVRVRTLNLEGDRQADLSMYGGWDKAVYVYPSGAVAA